MKIMVLADEPDRRLWELLDRQILKEVDMILSCGDLPAEYLSFLTCFTSAPVLYICGNHDESYVKAPPEGCICVEDQVYCCKGVRILGLGGSMRYRPGPYQYTEAQMRRRAKKLAFRLWRTGGFDILMTHAPARGIGDEEHIAHRGFHTFLDLMEKYSPRYMVHGHIHREYTSRFRRCTQWGNTVVVNANKSYIVELEPAENAGGRAKTRRR